MRSFSFRKDPRINGRARDRLREFCTSLESNVVALTHAFGLKVLLAEEELLPYERGYLSREPMRGSASGWVIRLNGKDPPAVQNFTTAHELGHFILHGARLAELDALDGRMNRNTSDACDPFSYLEKRDRTMESEANAFAAELLMPPNLFRPAHSRLNGDVAALARLFVVTEPAVRRRIAELGLR